MVKDRQGAARFDNCLQALTHRLQPIVGGSTASTAKCFVALTAYLFPFTVSR